MSSRPNCSRANCSCSATAAATASKKFELLRRWAFARRRERFDEAEGQRHLFGEELFIPEPRTSRPTGGRALHDHRKGQTSSAGPVGLSVAPGRERSTRPRPIAPDRWAATHPGRPATLPRRILPAAIPPATTPSQPSQSPAVTRRSCSPETHHTWLRRTLTFSKPACATVSECRGFQRHDVTHPLGRQQQQPEPQLLTGVWMPDDLDHLGVVDSKRRSIRVMAGSPVPGISRLTASRPLGDRRDGSQMAHGWAVERGWTSSAATRVFTRMCSSSRKR